ncbi:MAG: acyl-CoA/acyl-ACP dehydrogenase [Desulfurococcales archaeon]|nr:acyl-CoA/acyl-ACP dehydrogenase [Desulfurococcales archaeon]MEB3759149.1 acyl-CoA/acyl-ACP dehydrogenase [Desulfurococcales archaeon]MEB3772697.1 acyl-CoA/acyl-ACP dehydrogenase [Desulfurococcales archaeon]MEB3787015.1 acyl-CoA/acyl-ACP dehydrogenase [Desulfurococcales archaeon]MEB3799035.1 acyl-CoA/acyl-ACP dehydrogenase [Desulfurococcales archaeon]
MVDFEFSEDEIRFRDSVREFAKRYIEPKWVEIDEKGRIPMDLIKRIADQGLFAIPVPEEYGGMGGTMVMTALAVEEIAYHDPAVAVAVYTLLNNGWPLALALFGQEEAKMEVLPKVASGDAFFGIASTEPQGGSDVAGNKTVAKKVGDKWVINGEKAFISGIREIQELPEGGGFFLVAKTEKPGWSHKRITDFVVLPKWNGKIREEWKPTVYEEIGRHGLSTGGFTLENFEVDDKYRIGEVNKGFYLVLQGFNIARILVAAATVGSARWALDRAKEWLRTRKLFQGRPIASFEGVSFRYAELYTMVEAARYFVYKAAWMADNIYLSKSPRFKPQDLNLPVAMAKMLGPTVTTEVYTEVLKWFGAYGYTKECNAHRGWLGTFSYTIGAEGAQNIMKYIIARDTLGSDAVRNVWAKEEE